MKDVVWIRIPLEKRIDLERCLIDRNPDEMLAFLKELRAEVEKAAAG